MGSAEYFSVEVGACTWPFSHPEAALAALFRSFFAALLWRLRVKWCASYPLLQKNSFCGRFPLALDRKKCKIKEIRICGYRLY